MSSNLEKFIDMAAKGAYQLLQQHVCCDYKTSQRGNGKGARGTPLTGIMQTDSTCIPKMEETEQVKPDEDQSLIV